MTSNRSPAKIIPRAFPGISPDEVTELISSSQLVNHTAGEVLCREDAIEGTFFLILEGEVEVTKVINKDETHLLKKLGPGDFFGEMALIHKAPRAATVRALCPLITLEIHRDAFERVLKNSSSISLAMVHEISRRLRENDELAIDDLRMRARELAEAYQKLAEQEVARREFLTNISHQLRTPLMAAGGYLQMLQMDAIPPAEIKNTLETVARNVQQITTLVNDILFVQEMDLILDQFKPVNLNELLNRVVGACTEKSKARNVILNHKSDIFLPSVWGDAPSLERAFNALLDNAVKFSPEGGRVEIRLRRKDKQVAIAISDQGIGIEPGQLPHLFDRFRHLDKDENRVYDGLGLGLAITRQVIEQHKGRLDVSSKPGAGSTFTVWLNIGRENPGSQVQAVTI